MSGDRQRGPAAGRALDEPEQQAQHGPASSTDRGHRSARGVASPRSRGSSRAPRPGGHAQHDVDQEHRPPAQAEQVGVDQHPGQQRPAHGGQPEDRADRGRDRGPRARSGPLDRSAPRLRLARPAGLVPARRHHPGLARLHPDRPEPPARDRGPAGHPAGRRVRRPDGGLGRRPAADLHRRGRLRGRAVRGQDQAGPRGGGIPESIRDYFRRLPADRFPVIASMADTIVADSDQRFEFGVELFSTASRPASRQAGKARTTLRSA